MECTSLSAPDATETKRILFIGNSPNQLVLENEQYAWRNLLENMEAAIRDEIGYESDDTDMPFSARAVRLKNFIKQKVGESSVGADFSTWEQWLEAISKLDAGKVHLLVKELLQKDFQAILTTNYDYTFERVLSGSAPTKAFPGGKEANAIRRHGKVWHLHGEALDAESIVMTSADYIEAVHLLQIEKSEESWLNLFLNSDVYVCGFGVYFEELLFWYALQRRLELKPNARRKVVVYMFVANGKEKSTEQIRSLLQSYDVEVALIYVTEKKNSGGYHAAWFEVIGRLFGVAHNVGVLDEKATVSQAVQTSREGSPEVIRTVRSGTAASGNPDRCWMNIPLETFNRVGYIDFICYIDGVNYKYRCDSASLQRAFASGGVKVIQNSPTRYSFYLDYETGEIFKSVSANDTVPVITL